MIVPMRLIALLLGLALAIIPPGRALAQTNARATDPGPPDAATLSALLTQFDVPGMAVTTLEGCAVGKTLAVGKAIRDPATPVVPETAFEAASLAKPVFAYLVLQLVDAGRIDLDRPLAQTLSYPRITDQAAYGRITPRIVLTHRTGLPNWAPDRAGPLDFDAPPGHAYTYSGEGFELLRAHVEAVTGQSLDALFRDRLGAAMPHSAFAAPLPDGARPSRGHGAGQIRDLSFRGGAAGGLITTAPDYAAFLSLMCRGEGLSDAMLTAMLDPQSPAPQDGFPAPVSWGLGWAIMAQGDDTVVTHGGNNGEYRSLAGYMPATGDGLVVLTNGTNGAALIQALMAGIGG
ncbi:MAG: serine hydrolase domain-containing protein [Pseudomonadota bacterium]